MAGQGCHWTEPCPCCPTILSSQSPGLPEPRALLLPAGPWGQDCQHLSPPQVSLLRQVDQGGLLGGGASVPAPGRGPRVVQRSADSVGYSPNLASAVSFRIFSYCGERRPSGATRPHSLAAPHPLSLDPVVGMGDTQAGLEAHHPPPWGWCTFRAEGEVQSVGGQWGAGPGTHINPLSQKLLQHLAAQQPQLHRGLEGKALYQPDWPTTPLRAGGLAQRGPAT